MLDSSADVEARVNYITRSKDKPYAYEYDPPAHVARRSAAYEERRVRIRNARALVAPPSLDAKGFELRRQASQVRDFYDAEEVKRVYYPELERLVMQATGAQSVVVFDHTVRGNAEAVRGQTDIKEPVSRAHNDYTAQSALRRARDVLPPDEAPRLLRHRFVEVNVWRPIRGPLQRTPLAVLDAASLGADDLVATDLIYRDRRGEIYYVAHRPEHAWYYFPEMLADEVLLLKGYDSDARRAQFAPHAAFEHPGTPPDAPPRESIEARTFAFFAPNPRPSQSMVQWR